MRRRYGHGPCPNIYGIRSSVLRRRLLNREWGNKVTLNKTKTITRSNAKWRAVAVYLRGLPPSKGSLRRAAE
eukprot:6194310-Pleurochrysis_carterae.AAC.2